MSDEYDNPIRSALEELEEVRSVLAHSDTNLDFPDKLDKIIDYMHSVLAPIDRLRTTLHKAGYRIEDTESDQSVIIQASKVILQLSERIYADRLIRSRVIV